MFVAWLLTVFSFLCLMCVQVVYALRTRVVRLVHVFVYDLQMFCMCCMCVYVVCMICVCVCIVVV